MVMELTENSRQVILLVIGIFALGCFFASFTLFVSAAYIKVNVDARMKLIETYNSDVLPGLFLFVGVINLVQNLTCLYVCLQLRTVDNREGLMRMLLPILICGIILVIFEYSTAIASFVHISILEDEFEAGLKKGMEEYVKGGELKVEMDTVQSEYGCCGDLDYTGWFSHSWIDAEYLRASRGGAKKYFSGDGKYYSDDTPFSCCDIRSPRPCIHHHIHDNSRHHNYNYQVETTLYVEGCREVLMEVYSRVLWTVALIAIAIATAKTVALLLFRLIQTSLVQAEEEDDWEATTTAYIYFPKPTDDDLDEKEDDDDESDKADKKDKNKNKHESDSENESEDAADTDSESDKERVNVQTELNNNTNDGTDSSEGSKDSANKPIWLPFSFPTVYHSAKYGSDKNASPSPEYDDNSNQNREIKPPQMISEKNILVDKNGKLDDASSKTHCDDSGKKCLAVSKSDSEMPEIHDQCLNNTKGDGHSVLSTHAVPSYGIGASDGMQCEAEAGLTRSTESIVSSQARSKNVRFISKNKRLQNGQFLLAGMFLPSSKNRSKQQTKYRTSADNYKYSLVNTSSSSEEDEEDDEYDEEDEEDDDEDEGDTEENSNEEYDNCNNDNNNVDNNARHVLSEGGIFVEDVLEVTPLTHESSHCHTHNVGVRDGVNINEADCTLTRLFCSHDSPQKALEFRHNKDQVCNNRTAHLENQYITAENEDCEYSPGAERSCYHEQNDYFIKNETQEYNLKRKRIGKFQNHQMSSEFFNMATENTADKKRHLDYHPSPEKTLTHKNYQNTSNFRQSLCQEKRTITSHLGFSDMWPQQKYLSEMGTKCESSETETEIISVEPSYENNNLRQRFIGRSTPFPYEILRYETINSEEYGVIPTHIRSKHSISGSPFHPLSQEVCNNIRPTILNIDVLDSDPEVSRLMLGRTAQTVGQYYFPTNVRDECDTSDKTQNAHELYREGIQQRELHQHSMDVVEETATTSTRECDSGEANTRIPAVNNPDKNHYPYVNVGHTRTRIDLSLARQSTTSTFTFPLMLPSPSSFEQSGPIRNHVRSYQRSSVILASPYPSTSAYSPLNYPSPHKAVRSNPFINLPMETSTPIICSNQTSLKCQTLGTPTFDSNITQSLSLNIHAASKQESLSESNNIKTPTIDDKTRSTTLPHTDQSLSVATKTYDESNVCRNQFQREEDAMFLDQLSTFKHPNCENTNNVTSTKPDHQPCRVLISPFN